MYLNCKTWFSYRYGTFRTEELVTEAAEAGATALALTNINSTPDLWDFHTACLSAGIRPVLGAEIRNGDTLCYLLLARDLRGVCDINRFLSRHLQEGIPFPARPGPGHWWVVYPLGALPPAGLGEGEVIGVRPDEVNALHGIDTAAYPDRFVMRQPVTFRDGKGYNLHRLLRAINSNILLSKQEAAQIAHPSETLLPPARLLEAFRRHPSIVTATLRLIDTCHYEIDYATDKNKRVFSATAEDDRILLQKLAIDGLRHRYGKADKEAAQRVQKELAIIDRLGFNAYFLITWDVIRYAQSRGFFYVGRGSGANSIVAYCLGITDVDPIDLDLYFERFLNPHRTSPPDFDIDFSWQDRDEVIDYIFKRYGRDHVALLGMYSTFQEGAVLRELAKVFGLPKAEVDAIAANPEATLSDDRIQRAIRTYGALLQDFPNYSSIHPGGMLISEAPIYAYTALELPPKGFATAQIDMFVAEKVGLSKLDILSQRGLGHIKEAVRLVRANRGLSVDIHDVPRLKADAGVAAAIRRADTIGCFYVESPAMRQLLLKLRCDSYLSLVAASSIIRPGVAQSGMMRQYIQRFHNPGGFTYLHPKMKELLQETYGVMVYQEDVIKVAHHFAGLDMGEADVLRRAMSGKYRGRKEFERIRDRFFLNCRELGHDDAIAAEVWRQMESFGGYSFSKAHSASFAVESYQSLYLKTYYPAEFMVAVINNFGGFYATELYVHELRRTGTRVEAPCVQHSDTYTDLKGTTAYLGFVHVKSLDSAAVEAVLKARAAGGPFAGLSDFTERTGIAGEALNILIRIGALRFTGKGKKELLWEANMSRPAARASAGKGSGDTLFHEPPVTYRLPQLHHTPMEDAVDEIELLGFSLCDPFTLADRPKGPFTPARTLMDRVGKRVELLGYFVTQKPVRTVRGSVMHFGTFLDEAGDWIDTVHFPRPGAPPRAGLSGRGFYHMKGKVVEEFGVPSVEVDWLEKVGLKDT